MKKAILYCRVSTREQAETGHSLEAQEMLLRQYAKNHNLEVTGVIAVPESASGRRERFHFAEMLFRAQRHNIPHILTEKVDRISRNFKEAIKLQDWLAEDAGRRIHFVKQSLVIGQDSKSSDTFMWDIFLSMARQYSRNLSEEIKKGQRIAVAKGLFVGASKVGYLSHGRHNESPNGKARYPNPAMRGVIVEVFARLAAGQPAIDVWRWAQSDSRLKSTKGKPLPRTRFYKFLRDPFVCGQFLFNGVLYEGQHEAIISKQQFYAVQDILDGRKNRKKQKHSYIFQGMVSDEAGNRLGCMTAKGHAYYYKKRFYVREEDIDAAVIDWFAQNRLSDEGIEAIKTAVDTYLDSFQDNRRDERDAAMKRINQLDALLKNARQKMYAGVLTEAEYTTDKADFLAEREVILRTLPDSQMPNSFEFEPAELVMKTLQKGAKVYPRLSKEQKQAFARLFLLELECSAGNVIVKAKPEIEAMLQPLFLKSGGQDRDNLRTLIGYQNTFSSMAGQINTYFGGN